MSTGGKQVDYKLLRASERAQDKELSTAAFKWLAALPRAVRPIELGRCYPRIVNRFAAMWPYPDAVDAYMQELLIDQRGTRKGFAPSIAKEIAELRAYFDAEVMRTAASPWGKTNP